MPMPVAFKKDGAIDHAGRTRSLISIWMPRARFLSVGHTRQGMVMEIEERKKWPNRSSIASRGACRWSCISAPPTRSRHRAGKARRGLGVDAVGVVPPTIIRMTIGKCTHTTKPSHDPFQACQCLFTTTRKLPGSKYTAKANKIIETIAPNPLAGIKVSFIAFDKLLGYVYQLPKSVGVFPGGIFSL